MGIALGRVSIVQSRRRPLDPIPIRRYSPGLGIRFPHRQGLLREFSRVRVGKSFRQKQAVWDGVGGARNAEIG